MQREPSFSEIETAESDSDSTIHQTKNNSTPRGRGEGWRGGGREGGRERGRMGGVRMDTPHVLVASPSVRYV